MLTWFLIRDGIWGEVLIIGRKWWILYIHSSFIMIMGKSSIGTHTLKSQILNRVKANPLRWFVVLCEVDPKVHKPWPGAFGSLFSYWPVDTKLRRFKVFHSQWVHIFGTKTHRDILNGGRLETLTIHSSLPPFWTKSLPFIVFLQFSDLAKFFLSPKAIFHALAPILETPRNDVQQFQAVFLYHLLTWPPTHNFKLFYYVVRQCPPLTARLFQMT